MKMQKAIILLVVATIFSLLLLQGCASSSTSSEQSITAQATLETEGTASDKVIATKETGKVHILTFMGWGDQNEKKIFTQLIKKFEKENPKIRVNYIHSPSQEYMLKLQTQVAGNKSPDLYYLPPEYLMTWVNAGHLENLTPYLRETKIFDEKNIWESALDRYRFDGIQRGKGDIYALPKDLGPMALAYNKDIFKAAGVTPPTNDKPWTFEEFTQNAKKLTGKFNGKNVYAVGAYPLESAVWSNGADFLDASKTKITIAESKFIKGMQFVSDLINKYKVAPAPDEEASFGSYQRWINGQLAMFQMGPWDQPSFWELSFDFDIMPWAVGPDGDGQSRAVLGSMGFAVSSKSKNTKAAFELASYFAFDKEGQTSNYKMGMAVPNLIDMAKNEFMQLDTKPKNKQLFINIIEQYGNSYPREYTFGFEWWDAFWVDSSKVWTGKVLAEQYCKELQPNLQLVLDKDLSKKK